ncbi:MAG: cytochrome c oxidase assembly protein, partial [Rhodospirillaceae bacterium]|nr:cytochrome c oxidase assembly protein [Rhodospirillaceae bacterium]
PCSRLGAARGAAGGGRRAAVAPAQAEAATAAPTLTVLFDSNVAPGLDWDFHPEQRQLTVKLGEPTTIYYVAKNRSDHTQVARAVFNVTPDEIAPYFFKLECFCFTNERLEPGESARMPVQFYVDRQAAADGTAKDIRAITLSYTFYPQTGLSPEEAAQARDLAAGSAAEAQAQAAGEAGDFVNDAPRRW